MSNLPIFNLSEDVVSDSRCVFCAVEEARSEGRKEGRKEEGGRVGSGGRDRAP